VESVEDNLKRNIKLTIAYDGSDYHGWQRQAEGLVTVQQTLEEALCRVVNHPLTIRGSGRTDTGVHALGQVANFRTTSPIPAHRLHHAINSRLPRTIRIHSAEDVADDFDAMRSVQSKLYRYVVLNHQHLDPCMLRYCYHVWHPCDEGLMLEAAAHLVGRHDFIAFATTGNKRLTTVRNLMRCDVNREDKKIVFDLQADGFLYNMVRNIVGTLLEIGRGYWPASKAAEILAGKDRQQAGPKAPPNGLTLQEVYY
jgi:tRNA pseudouridine38-40 synthase